MREQDLRDFVSQKLFEIGSALMAYYDCCALRGSACKAGDPNPCCSNTIYSRGLCPFMLQDTCHFNSANCKLWICETAIDSTDPKCVQALKLLEQLGGLFDIIRPPFIGQGYSGADHQRGSHE